MRLFWLAVMLLSVALVAWGCRPSGGTSAASPPAPPAAGSLDEPQRAQGRLPTVRLWLGPHEITAEVARTAEQIRTGMMYRTNLAENEGMLFVFGIPHQAAFWMKHVSVPLSCAYLDPEGVVLEVHDMHPHVEAPILARSARVQFVLETPQGWFSRHQVGPGTLVRTEAGSLAEAFLRAGRRSGPKP